MSKQAGLVAGLMRPFVRLGSGVAALGQARPRIGAENPPFHRKPRYDDSLDGNGFDVAGLYDMYAERIAAHRADPPPPDWNGVYEAESK